MQSVNPDHTKFSISDKSGPGEIDKKIQSEFFFLS